jgi:hypothetical protein
MRKALFAGRSLAIVSAALLLFAAAQGAVAQEVMYGSTAGNGGGEFGTVDQSNADFTLLGDPTTTGPLPAMALNSLGEVFASNNLGGSGGAGGSGSHGVLIRIDPSNGQLLATIGDITDSADQEQLKIADFDFQPGTDVLFGVVSKGTKEGFLYTIDTGTAVATLVGDTGLNRGGLGFAPDGTLYLGEASSRQGEGSAFLAQIDPSTAQVVGTPVPLQNAIESLAVRPSDGAVFVGQADGSTLYTVDPATGLTTQVGLYDFQNHVAALTFQPAPITVTRVQSFLVPERVTLKLSTKRPDRSTLKINARLDECCAVIDYEQAVTLEINGTTWNLPGLTGNSRGTVFKHTDDELRVVLRPRLKGSSRGVLSITLRRDMTGLVGPDENVAVRVTAGTLDASATARLSGTRYIRGRDGDFTGPMIFPISARVRTNDPAGSSVRATFGLNALPGPPGDVTVGVGSFQQVVPADEFAGTEDRPRWSSRDPGVRSVRVDYRRGKLTVSISKATLGVTGADLVLTLGIGGETVEMTITPRAKGSSLSY